jgi:hypothetical protein
MNLLKSLKDKIARYIDVNVKLFKINFIQHTSNILSYFIFTIVSLFLLLAILIFMGLGLAEVFTAMVNSRIGGFFMVMGAYILLLIFIFGIRKWVIRGFAGAFIRILTEQDKDEEEEKVEEQTETEKP